MSNDQRRESHVMGMLRTGAMIGAGYGVFRNRQAIGRAVGRATNNLVAPAIEQIGLGLQNGEALHNAMTRLNMYYRATTSIIGDSPTSASVIKSFVQSANSQLGKERFISSFQTQLQQRLKQQRPYGQTSSGPLNTFFKDLYDPSKLNNPVNKEYVNRANFVGDRQQIRDLSRSAILNDSTGLNLHSSLPLGVNPNQLEQLMSEYSARNKKFNLFPVINRNNLGDAVKDFIKTTDEKLGGLQFSNRQHREEFQQKLFQTLNSVKVNTLDVRYRNQQEQLGLIQVVSASKRYSKAFNSTMAHQGYRPLTFGDALDMTSEQRRAAGLTTSTLTGTPKAAGQFEVGEVDPIQILKDLHDKHAGDIQFASILKNDYGLTDIRQMHMGSGLFIKDGKVADFSNLIDGASKGVHGFQETFRIPFLGFNPLDLTPLQTMKAAREADGVRPFFQGKFEPFLTGSKAKFYDQTFETQQANAAVSPLAEDLYYAGGKVWRGGENGLEVVHDSGFIIPGYGPYHRAGLNMANLTGIEQPDTRNGFMKLFGLGRQEQDGYFSQWLKSFNKGKTPEYAPSTLRFLQDGLHEHPDHFSEERVGLVQERFQNLYNAMFSTTRSLESETIESLAPHINQHFNGLTINNTPFDIRKLQDDNYLIDFAVSVVNGDSPLLNLQTSRTGYNHVNGQLVLGNVKNQVALSDQKAVRVHPLTKEIYDYVSEFAQNPQVFLNATRQSPQRQLETPLRTVMPFVGEEHLLIKRTEDLRKTVHQFIIESFDEQARLTGGRDSVSLLSMSQFTDPISHKDIENLEKLKVFSSLKDYKARLFGSGYGKVSEARTFTEDLFGDNLDSLTPKGAQYQRVANNTHKWYERAPEQSAPDLLGGGIMFVPKGRVMEQTKQALADINKATSTLTNTVDPFGVITSTGSAISNATGVFQEIFAGRKSLNNVTSTTMMTYYMADRLNNAVSLLHLGLPREQMGSFASILGNQFVRRVALPYMAYQQLVYFDGMLGDKPSDAAADGYVTGHQFLNTIKDFTQINKAFRPLANVLSQTGFDQIKDWQGVQQFNFLTMGMFSDFRSGEEVRQYYESGEDPVRRSRYWGIGSTTPWSGGRIDHFEPNWYRKLKSDYRFTDTMYGSESEYWANNWMPTLTHPLAPLRHFIFDSKHYEKKHEKDRPYAYTGGFEELESIPLIGGAVDTVASGIFKPREAHRGLAKAHKEYIAAYNDMLRAKAGESDDGTLIRVGAAGGIDSYNLYGPQGAGYGYGEGVVIGGSTVGGTDSGLSSNGITYGAGSGVVVSGLPRGNGTAGVGTSKATLASINAQLAQDGKAQKSLTPNQVSGLANPFAVDFNSIQNLRSMSSALNSSFYSASELAGIYGFALKTGMNYEESIFDLSWQTSSGMASYRRAFWDQNLGGMGGALSEIGRRYLPRDVQKNAYSPIRNTMPDWLPGMEYYTDFLHGDPYTKIQKGEMRLPGKSYERLYKLHPDGTGTGEWSNYGTFDRFRILADVAPTSQQYKIVRSQVSAMKEQGLLDDDMLREYDQVKEQVKEKKERHHFYRRKFSETGLITNEVTITEVLDPNTFLTKEYGPNPIKLAGVKLSQDDTDAVEWLHQFIKVGARVKVGIDKDPMNRMNNDVMGTMSAVVYAPHNEEGSGYLFGSTHSIKGQSINALLANRTWKHSDVKINDDGSATSTNALYSPSLITVGSMMEHMTHDILPNVPFLGIFADKFLQTRSPVESYIRDQVYNKEWKEWTNPVRDWIVPMVQTISTKNPLIAGAQMGAIGGLFFKPLSGIVSSRAKYMGITAGFFTGAMLASVRSIYEASSVMIGNNKTLVPERRLKEREVDEYFDRLQYVKYRGLYEKAKNLAIEYEGVDPAFFAEGAKQKGMLNKMHKHALSENKKWLSIFKKTGYGDEEVDPDVETAKAEVKSINQQLNGIGDDKQVYHAGKYASLALQYKKQYESTLYGADPRFANMQDLFAAMNPVDREYIPEILQTATPKERQKILKVVSPDIRRILQAKWGLDVDKQESIESYFTHHPLPGPNWEGWHAGRSLEDVKIKVMKQKGMELKAAGYWADDENRADANGAKSIPVNSTLLPKIDPAKIAAVLKGRGLSDVDVTMSIAYSDEPSSINTQIDFKKDIHDAIVNGINEFKQNIFS